MTEQGERRKASFKQRVEKLPLHLAIDFMMDMDTAIDNRLRVFENEAQRERDLKQ